MRRPKSKIRREIINTTIDKKLLGLLGIYLQILEFPLIYLSKTHLEINTKSKPRNSL